MSRARGLRLGALLGLVLAVLGLLSPQAAWAASDQVDSWKIDYAVQPTGDVRVTETLVYRFGSVGRHGITRSFVTREKWDDRSDAVYQITDIRVSSPDAPSRFTTQTDTDGRNAYLTVRVGSPTETVRVPTASYTLSYTVKGAMRSSQDYDEFYWDALSGETPLVRNIQVSATVPGGVKDVDCNVGVPPTRDDCTSFRVNGRTGEYRQSVKQAGEVMTIGARIAKGQVSVTQPDLVTRADRTEQLVQQAGLGAGALSLVLSPLLGWRYWRRKGRDLRYVGLPPGVLPAQGQSVAEKPTGRIEIPVAFSPPQISVAEAGLLVDGAIDTKETTATLVDLAVRGAVKLASEPGATRVRLVDFSKATEPHEQVLLQRLFAYTGGGEVELASQGSMLSAHEALVTSVRNQVARRRWFTRGTGAAGAGFGCSGLLMLAFAWFFFGGTSGMILWLALPLVPVILTSMVVRSKMQRGQRTGLGRAYADQVEGFRHYLATAEADQLRFEEGEDIFSRYLPWAIAFGLAERWADLCAQLVRMGRLSAEPPVWYYGPYNYWNFYVFNDSLSTIDHAASPAPPPPTSIGSSGSGFGGGSSFGGGGGFAGGGGGGGGVGSW
ncbi:DUF2207 domain-containing protein [Luteococcus peritonei]|uniref:DUF2207 domain-containing protein n=1 Tax=Luteococcus peritonei TaxID=88874 RepID=A0ABW4RSV6_9ACTN